MTFRNLLRCLALSVACYSATTAADPGLVTTPPADPAGAVAVEGGWMVPYTETIPGTEATFDMVPVPGGVVRIAVGPVTDEEPVTDEDTDEEAFVEVELPPYWVGRAEVTWSEFRPYMALNSEYAALQQLATLRGDAAVDAVLAAKPQLAAKLSAKRTAEGDTLAVDAVTAPTPLYDPSTTYESGEDPALPAVTMTPFAARQYTKWLSALCGRDYRLPSEAEWMHAASDAGKAEEPEDLDAVAWHTDNAEFVAHPVGEKAPTALGLVDVLGNAAELVLDGLYEEGRPELAGKRVDWRVGVAWPRESDPRVAKGGWYDGETSELTFASRMPTDDDEWKASDPNLPRSPWWYADYPATGVGFRVVRPLEPIAAEDRPRVWDAEDPAVAKTVTERLREGRGKMGPIGADLPAVLEGLRDPAVKGLLK